MTQSHDVFLSFTWSDIVEVEKLDKAMRAAGLRVFRDSLGIKSFDGITAELRTALAESKVLLAYYSRRFPTRYACQWELTSAFLAAQSRGIDPRRRVLVINPEQNGDHIGPVELQDAAYVQRPRKDAEMAEIVARVAEVVHATASPLGTAHSAAPMLPRLLHPRRFVGRYRELWQIHSALHARELPPAVPRVSSAMVVVRGLAGMGKTSLAEQYAFLFRDAYPGGMHWTGPLDGADTRAQFHASVRAVAAAMGLRVHGMSPEQVRAVVAARIETAGEAVLWIVDDVPSGLAAEVLNELIIPSALVRTVLTTRTSTPHWPAPVVELTGLSAEEGEALYDEILDVAEDERAAIARLVARSGGHPMIITSSANSLRARQGALHGADFVGLLDGARSTVADVLRGDIDHCGPTAVRVLRLAAALSLAPIPPRLAREVIIDHRLPEAVEELTLKGLLRRVGSDWDVHALVRDTAGTEDELTRAAAEAVMRLLPYKEIDHLHRHAAALAEQECVPDAQRAQLLRAGLDWFREQGDIVAARAGANRILRNGAASANDRIAAAGALIDAGDYTRAIDVLAAPDTTNDGVRARLLLAQALDHLGRYDEADRWWPSAVPDWMTGRERVDALVAIAVGHRLRGRFQPALDLLADEPLDDRARLERARLLIITGRIRPARQLAAEVIAGFDEPELLTHPLLLAAIGVQAEAELTFDLVEFTLHDENWDRVENELRATRDKLTRLLGKESPLTVAAAVRCARASVPRGRPKQALRELGELEPVVVKVFTDRHPLCHWLRYSTAQAHAQLKNYDRAAAVLQDLLRLQLATIGEHHPDTMMTQLDLGIALAMTGRKAAAEELVAVAERRIGEALSWRADLRARAAVTRRLFVLPQAAWSLFGLIDRKWWQPKPE
ncbi:TIR domain-containing protein [Kutzneria sp. 744]|uniref:tetratricopeptide repeat protein n=1 Tax=Kutzneria sp. (strain 744) TaxID=345341 RepID=UPI0018DD67A3|nr:TIR domain-containing protein [Kutzneria sp. 744]